MCFLASIYFHIHSIPGDSVFSIIDCKLVKYYYARYTVHFCSKQYTFMNIHVIITCVVCYFLCYSCRDVLSESSLICFRQWQMKITKRNSGQHTFRKCMKSVETLTRFVIVKLSINSFLFYAYTQGMCFAFF